jgi:hypothetical protein
MVAVYPEFLHVTSLVTVTSTPPIVAQSVAGEGLRVTWSVRKSNSSEPDTARVTIYNLALASRKLLEALVPALPGFAFRCALSIGWGDAVNPGPGFVPPTQVLAGRIWSITPELRERTDVLTVIEFGDGLVELRDAAPGGASLAAQILSWSSVVSLVAAELGLTVSPAALAVIDAAALRQGLPVYGAGNLILGDREIREKLDNIFEALRIGYTIDNGILRAFDGSGLRNDLPPQVLAPLSGLLSFAVTDDGGVEFEALANPLLAPGSQVTVLNDLGIVQGGGPLRVESIEFAGDNYENSLMRGVARRFRPV